MTEDQFLKVPFSIKYKARYSLVSYTTTKADDQQQAKGEFINPKYILEKKKTW